jgi:hypothetical protein
MLGLTLLLNNAAHALDHLSLLYMTAGSDVLTPEYRDLSLALRLDGPACAAQAALRQQLAAMAAQLRVVGLGTSVAAILDRPEAARRRAALLALAAAGRWEVTGELPRGGQLHRRVAADGQVYLLAGQPDRGAAHAPHAARGYAERLWILPPGHACDDGHALPAEPPALSADGLDSLGLQAARRDLILELTAGGHAALAARLAGPGQATPLPAAVAVPDRMPAVAA